MKIAQMLAVAAPCTYRICCLCIDSAPTEKVAWFGVGSDFS